MPAVDQILGVILGGGQGSRLHPLTRDRAKPAVPIAGKYRLIDIPISNCINAGITKIAVLTQYSSVSLHRHISQTYFFDAFSKGWVQIWAAEQTLDTADWYQGTADAVRKQLLEIRSANCPYTIILAGDHLYRMDYDKMAEFHWDNKADITVAVQPVHKDEAYRFGLLKVNKDNSITDFVEKPKEAEAQKPFVSRDDPEYPFLGSMGIYMFNTDVLVDVLSRTKDDDFGGEVIPSAIKTHNVAAYNFEGYWEDIGTIRSFYETNLSLARPDSPFNFHDPTDPIYTHPRFLPGSTIDGATLTNVLLADGCRIHRAEISNSIVGLRSQVEDGVVMSDTILMGADYYDTPERLARANGMPIGIGANSHIEAAILDKNARIGEGVVIERFPRGTNEEREDCVVIDGIVVIPKSTTLPAGARIAP
ncbi:MAG: glucose-1-phosphate adenylyltransferase [Chloroflexi bacterium]|nr:MAG: glucose-1-phosphate adenylyltransferase [Chloroflexota bacterium]MBL1193649.1 glucose-1-phosphate adenylyltransferase [Chloroflexota bacterium]NOH10941.1 glucose-1-phosphate adenylyltransferase [Chloroflexota bacterium]